MKLRTKTFENKEENNFDRSSGQARGWQSGTQEEALYFFPVPEYIEQEIEKKWFYLYNWIDESEVKSSVERDFLGLIHKYWVGFAIFFMLFWLGMYFFKWIFIWIGGFFIACLYAFFIGYILVLTVKRSLLLRKFSQLIITNNYFSINQEIKKLANKWGYWNNSKSIYGDQDFKDVWVLFEEEIFRESDIKDTKSWLFRKVSDSLTSGFSKILDIFWSRNNDSYSKEWGQLIIIAVAIYFTYILWILGVYIFGIFFVMLVWNLFAFLNKKYLLAVNHSITQISEGFKKIDEYGNFLDSEKKELSFLLREASENNWKDGLLLKINDGIEKVENWSKKSLESYKKLEKDIDESEYSQMFEKNIYKNWLKNEIITPLKEIEQLLERNKEIIKNMIWEIEQQITETSDEKNKEQLQLASERLAMRSTELQQYGNLIHWYLKKLEG